MDPKNATILLIEDDVITVDMYALKFKISGLRLETAITPEDGRNKIRELKPDLILLDLKIDGTDGFEILSAIKSNEETKHIPVYAFTNMREKGNKERAERLGAEGYILKAKVKPDEVIDEVKKRLECIST